MDCGIKPGNTHWYVAIETFQFHMANVLFSYLFSFSVSIHSIRTHEIFEIVCHAPSIVHIRWVIFFHSRAQMKYFICCFNISCNAACRWLNYVIYLNGCKFISLHTMCINWNACTCSDQKKNKTKENTLNLFSTNWAGSEKYHGYRQINLLSLKQADLNRR